MKRSGPHERLRGRAGTHQRLRRLAAEPLCRHCKAEGRVTVATVPDHIIALSKGGKDDDTNIQCLCDDCHEKKTRAERGWSERAKQTVGVDGWPEDKA